MNTSKQGLLTRVGAFALTLVMAFSVILFGAATSDAQEPGASAAPEKSDVVITKWEQPANFNAPATGAVYEGDKGEAIPGVQFELHKVLETGIDEPYDVGTNAGQAYAASLLGTAGLTLSEPATELVGTTALGTGEVVFENVPRALYVVKEVATDTTPAGVTLGKDFLLTVPMTNPSDRNDWLDTIFVYPKNSIVRATKSVDDAAAKVAANNAPNDNIITWKVKAEIPRNNPDVPADRPQKQVGISKFEIVDNVDPRLSILDGTNAPSVQLINSPDVSLVPADYELTTSGQEVKLVFTEPGRAKLVQAWQKSSTAQVELTITTQANSAALNPDNTDAAEIENTATVYVNDAATDVKTNTASVKVGDIKIKKKDSNDGTGVNGAQFSVYANETDAKDKTNPLSINDQTIWTTAGEGAAAGEVKISGLFFSNYINGETVSEETNYRSYWIAEVKAPEGYQLLAQPLKVNVTEAGSDVAVTEISNAPNAGGFELPLTGGSGTALLTIAGIAILGVVLFVARRRSATES